MENGTILIENALAWIKNNISGTNECIHATVPKDDRNATVQGLIDVGNQRGRQVVGALPYGVGQLKSQLIKELGYSAEQANFAVSSLKQDERLYQVGRGLGKMLVCYNGDPKQTDAVPAPNPVAINWPQTATFNDPQYTIITPGYATVTDIGATLTTEGPEPQLPPRVAKWITINTTPRKPIRKAATKVPLQLEAPPMADYGDLQDIYDETERMFQEQFAKLKAKCDELAEENMVLNQATWQS